MANLYSDLYINPVNYRGVYNGQEFEVTGVIKVKAGVKLTAGDVLRFVRLGPKVALRKITLAVSGELDDGTVALDGEMGWLQVLGTDGVNPLVIDDKTGTTYTSPTSDPNGIYAAAGQALEGDILQAQGPAVRVFTEDAASGNAFAAAAATLAANGLEGVVDLGITITESANGDAAEDVYIRMTATCIQREGSLGDYSGPLADAYSYRYNSSGSSGGLVS